MKRFGSGHIVAWLVVVAFLSFPLAGQVASGSRTSATRALSETSRVGSVLTPAEFKKRLVGPILVIPTPFNSDLSIDHQGVRRMIEGAMKHDLKVVALTAGDSLYSVLSETEIRALTKTMVESAGNRALTIGAAGRWKLKEGETVEDVVAEIVSYARFAEGIGVSGLQVLLPGEMTEDDYVRYYGEVAAKTKLPLVLHGNFPEPLLKRLVELPSISAVKEDIGLQYLIDRLIVFGDRLVIFPGGAESRYLVGYPYGCKAYYSVMYQYAPDLGQRFWKMVQAGRIREAGEFVRRYEYPLMSRFTNGLWHAALEYFGVAPRFLRPPYETLPEDRLGEVKEMFDQMGVKPAKAPR